MKVHDNDTDLIPVEYAEERSPTFRVAIEASLKHGLLYQLKEQKGLTSRELAEMFGVSKNLVSKWVNMRATPITRALTAEKRRAIEDFIGCSLEEAWPPHIFTKQWMGGKRNAVGYSDLTDEDVLRITTPSLLPDESDSIERHERKEVVHAVIGTLSEREQEVIRMRFYDGKSIADCANELKVTQGRIRQIESRALNRLRHPKRRRLLQEIL